MPTVSKTWQNIIDEARQLLQDTSAPYRHSDTVLRNKLNRGLAELSRVRPDAFWDRFIESDILVPEIVLSDPDPDTDPEELDEVEDAQVLASEEYTLPIMFYTPLVYYVVSAAELVEDEFTQDGRAVALLNEFKRMCVGL